MAVQYLTLMNKNRPVCGIEYNTEGHFCHEITRIWDAQAAPPAMVRADGTVTEDTFNGWWRRRAVPATRADIGRLMASAGIRDTRELLEANRGLSLSDRYWLSDGTSGWDEINYFDNPFRDFALMEGHLSGKNAADTLAQFGPDSSLGGNMNKFWRIDTDGKRYLWKKSGVSTGLDVYAEEIASALHALVFAQGEYVPYKTIEEDGNLYAVCPNMLGADEELVPAYDLIVNRPQYKNTFTGILSMLEETGVPDAENFLNRMFASDFLIANTDRHYGNFGVIRNVETLKYVRMAPVFDSGNALWHGKLSVNPEKSSAYWAKPFGSTLGGDVMQMMKELTGPGCLEGINLEPFYRRAGEILHGSPYVGEKRARDTLAAMHAQEGLLQGIAREKEQAWERERDYDEYER